VAVAASRASGGRTSGWGDDLRHALRSLRRRPASSIGVVVVLALGLGASSAVFSLVHAVLLEPLPFREADRLVRVESVAAGEPGRVSMREVLDLRAEQGLFDDVAAYIPGLSYTVSTESFPQEMTAVLATHNLFSVLGAAFEHGGPWPEHYDRSRNFGLVLGNGAFRRDYASDERVIASSVMLSGVPDYQVFGVLAEGYDFPFRSDVYRSIFLREGFPGYEGRGRRVVVAVARLADGLGLDAAQQRLDAVTASLAEIEPVAYRETSLHLVPLRATYVGEVRPHLLLLSGAVGLLLLLACANAANLLLVRGLARGSELALRGALGASRLRLLRQLVLEGVVVAVVAAALGLGAAQLGVRALVAMVRFDLPSWMRVELDPWSLAFAALLSLLTGVLVSAVPALRATGELASSLQGGGRGGGAGARQRRLQDLLLAAEVAFTVVLLAGCALSVRSLARLLDADPGFRSQQVLSFRVALTWLTYRDDDLVRNFHREVLAGLEALPGVERAALDSNLPMTRTDIREEAAVRVDGQAEDAWRDNPRSHVHRVSEGYFETMGIPLLAGRSLGPQDRVDSPLVALVSARLAERLWPGADPLGRRLQLPAPNGEWREVVGVVGDTRLLSAAERPAPTVYLPATQPRPPDMMHFVARTSVPPLSLSDEAIAAVRAADPDQAVFDVTSMAERLRESEWQRRVSRDLLAVFAAVALALSVAGVYGVVAYLGRQRRRELGIRLALGAGRLRLVTLLAGRSFVLAAVGAAIGLAAGLWLARFLEGLLFEMSVRDPWTFALVPVVLLLVAGAAALVPAVRASRLEANRVLRED
jgi:putative ABC transport system permease protein